MDTAEKIARTALGLIIDHVLDGESRVARAFRDDMFDCAAQATEATDDEDMSQANELDLGVRLWLRGFKETHALQ